MTRWMLSRPFQVAVLSINLLATESLLSQDASRHRPHPPESSSPITTTHTKAPQPDREAYRRWLQLHMKAHGLEGASVALVSDEALLWSEALGEAQAKQPVNPQTRFSIQSMSKSITAAAVLVAVQEGLVELDAPITRYLPDFRVNSCFEEHPQEKITLRLLLGHGAGFTHEAPVGNNYDASFPSIAAHLRSIRETWLKFPVGKGYAYSNLGFDLAAQILEKVSGQSFARFLENRLFQPLGMLRSSVDADQIQSDTNRAKGHAPGFDSVPERLPLLGSGAVFSAAEDMARFLQFHLRFGRIQDQRLISEQLWRETLKPVIPGNPDDYTLGMTVENGREFIRMNHNGGGFGFGSTMTWLPEYRLGVVILGNRWTPGLPELADRILKDCIQKGLTQKTALPPNWIPDKAAPIQAHGELCKGQREFQPSWKVWCRTYEVQWGGGWRFNGWSKFGGTLGFGRPKVKIFQRESAFYLKFHNGSEWLGDSRLTEIQPGLFLSQGGETLDFRNGQIRYRNILLK